MAELKARISLDSSQFKRALADVTKAANKATRDLGGVGKAGAIAGQAVAAGALTLGAVLVGKNAKAFAAVRNASVALGASVAVAAARIQAIGPALAKGKGAFAAFASAGVSSFKVIGNALSLIGTVAQGVATRVISALSSILSVAAKVGGAIAAAGAVVGGVFAAGIHKAVEFGASLANLSARTGAPVKDLAILQKAFASVGIDAEKVGPAINKMQKAISGVNEEGKPTKAAFDALGISIESLRGKSPIDQFNAVHKALASIKDPADRAAIAMDLFGKSGGELNALFQNPEAIKNAQQALGGQADLLAKNAEKFHRVAEAFANIGDKVRGFFIGIASGLIDKLTALADVLNSIDLSGFGKRIGDTISSALNIIVNAFKQGKLGALVGLTLKAGFATAGDYLIGIFQAAIKILAASVGVIFSADFFQAIILGFNGVALKLTAFLSQALADPIAAGAALLSIGFQKAISVFNGLKILFADIAAFFVAAITTGIQKVISLLPKSLKPAGFKAKSFADNLKEKRGEFAPDQGVTFQSQSFSEAFAEQRKTYQPAFVKGVNGLADETLSAAATTFGTLGSKIADIFRRNIGNFQPGDVFHSAEVRQELESLAKSLNVPFETVKKAAEQLAGATDGDFAKGKEKEKKSKSGFHLHTDADQFARIGLFARVAHSPGLDYHRETAKNTGKMVSLLEAHLSKPKMAVAA
jgi:hypothetical protein